MIDADLTAIIAGCSAGLQDIEIGEREPMVFVVVSEKRERWIFVNDLRFEDITLPCDHLIEAPGLIDHVGELHGLYHCCLPLEDA